MFIAQIHETHCLQFLEEEEEDARLLARCEEKRRAWAVQHGGARSLGQAGEKWEVEKIGGRRAGVEGRRFRSSGSVMDFILKFFPTCRKKREETWWNSLRMWNKCGRWPQQACTTMFFLVPKNVASDRPIALIPTMIRWWEGLRAPEVSRWQQRHRVGWDDAAPDGKIRLPCRRDRPRSNHTGACLVTALERVSLPVVWPATHCNLSRKVLRVLCGYFEHQRRVQFEGCVAEPLRTITAILPGSKWSCLLIRL